LACAKTAADDDLRDWEKPGEKTKRPCQGETRRNITLTGVAVLKDQREEEKENPCGRHKEKRYKRKGGVVCE